MNKFKKIRLSKDHIIDPKKKKQKPLSQKNFADLLGTTETSINRYENNKRKPSKSLILLMTFSTEALKFAEKKAKRMGLL